jgi:hypothetical protein
LEKNSTFLIYIRPSDTNWTLFAKWGVEEMTCLRGASNDGYNSYHYECIEKQTCHTLNKLFVVGRKHKDLASPIQLGKWKSFVVLFKNLLQMKSRLVMDMCGIHASYLWNDPLSMMCEIKLVRDIWCYSCMIYSKWSPFYYVWN